MFRMLIRFITSNEPVLLYIKSICYSSRFLRHCFIFNFHFLFPNRFCLSDDTLGFCYSDTVNIQSAKMEDSVDGKTKVPKIAKVDRL